MFREALLSLRVGDRSATEVFVHPVTGEVLEATENKLALALADIEKELGRIYESRRSLLQALAKPSATA
jgi:hypothetical protein